MGAHADLIPIHVLTGFLGSGKTTVLKRLLQSPRLTDTAVLVNEFGEGIVVPSAVGRFHVF